MDGINLITVLIVGIFIVPILAGILRPVTGRRILNSFLILLSGIGFFIALVLSIYITKAVFSGSSATVNVADFFNFIPELRSFLSGKNFLIYILSILFFMFAAGGILHVLTLPVYRYVIPPVTRRITAAASSMNNTSKRIFCALCRIPEAVCLVLVFSISVSIFSNFGGVRFLSDYIDSSSAYRFVCADVMNPIFGTGIIKQIPVMPNETFKQASTEEKRSTLVVVYFNGTALTEAVKSNADIDAAANRLIGEERNEREKAYLIYLWICRNIKYDEKKAAAVAAISPNVVSGAVAAYTARSGICFDYACLYTAMCRAVGLKVRIISGSGYTGTAWGDHAWNQVCTGDDKWINVDATYGSTGMNYFDRPDFSLDHSNSLVEGEW